MLILREEHKLLRRIIISATARHRNLIQVELLSGHSPRPAHDHGTHCGNPPRCPSLLTLPMDANTAMIRSVQQSHRCLPTKERGERARRQQHCSGASRLRTRRRQSHPRGFASVLSCVGSCHGGLRTVINHLVWRWSRAHRRGPIHDDAMRRTEFGLGEPSVAHLARHSKVGQRPCMVCRAYAWTSFDEGILL